MIKVYQTIISNKEETVHGNCLIACIASILELNINEVPEFQNMERKWFPCFYEFLISKGYEFHGTGKKENILTYDKGIDGYYIVNGASPRGFKRGHSVVYYKGKLVHDPFIGGDGLSDFWGFFMIEKKRV